MTVTINGTTGIAGTNGSAATPAVQGEDTNTGVFFPAADTVAVSTGGSERLRVDASGNLGVGTASPGGRLDVVGANGSGALQAYIRGGSSAGDYSILNIANGSTIRGRLVADASVDAFRIDTAGGASTPITFLTGSSYTERARIDASGSLLVGKTTTDFATAGVRLAANGEVISTANGGPALFLNRLSSNGNIATFDRNTLTVGSISVTTTATSYNTSSDYRLKENVQPMQDALAVVAQLNPVTYTWKADGSSGQGFIAHELQAVVPDCVTGEKDAVDEDGNPMYQGVDTSFLVATLTKAIQELKAELDAAKARIAVLEGV